MNALLAALLLMQDQGAQDLYDAVQKKLLDAKSARIAFTCEGTYDLRPEKQSVKFSGTVLLRQDNKFRADYKIQIGSDKGEAVFISDGATFYRSNGQNGKEERGEIPPYLSKGVVAVLVRSGAAWEFVGPSSPFPPSNPELQLLRPKDLKLQKAAPERSKLSFRFGSDTKVDVVLHVDTAVSLPKSRDLSCDWGPVLKMSLVEKYEEFVLNPEIPDEKFKIPPARQEK
jgi:hypothetical protein